MQRPPLPLNEVERIADLYEYDILDTTSEEDFENIARLAASICNTSMAAISFVDAERQWFKARHGVFFRQTSRKHSFCAHTILNEGFFIVRDTLDHEVFRQFPYVTGGPRIRFYGGIALHSHRGHRIGSLCVMDDSPRFLDGYQQRALSELSRQVSQLLENRRLRKRLKRITQVQNRFQELLVKEVKSSLGATGTFLNALENYGPELIPGPGFCSQIAGQFQRTLAIFDCLVQWRNVQELDRYGIWPTVDAHRMATDVLRRTKREPCAKGFSFVNTSQSIEHRPLPDDMIVFILKLLLLWICDVAEDGEIDFHLLTVEDARLKMGISLRSRSFLPHLRRKLEKLEKQLNGPLWSEALQSPVDNLCLLLAKDVLNGWNGELSLNLGAGLLDATIDIPLNR
ncbi:MAG TPA: GAF domain-containing protein [Puia sp.]|nr:GAF domain-containing protein [Puia sp.]